MSEIKVNSIKGVGASAAAITVNNTDGTCTANITNNLSNRNLIINGAMQVAQRLGGGVATTSQQYQTVDRFKFGYSGADENPTQMQSTVSSGTTPYTLGFRNTFKITNGNQTSGAGSSDYAYIDYAFEAQDIANSGWNYNSASSFVTFSFWIKSSVAQSFKGYFITGDGTDYSYAFDTGSLSADTWTKVTKTISGNSNITVNNDNGRGLGFSIWPFIGTDLTSNSTSEDAWVIHSGSARTKDATSTWWTTDNATLEFTGFQLEVGSVATDFEHRSFAQELALCQRYYYKITPLNSGFFGVGNIDGGSQAQVLVPFPTKMRVKPASLETTGTANQYAIRVTGNVSCTSVPVFQISSTDNAMVDFPATSHGFSSGQGAFGRAMNDDAYLGFSSEL
jgi:hypothetical protein